MSLRRRCFARIRLEQGVRWARVDAEANRAAVVGSEVPRGPFPPVSLGSAATAFEYATPFCGRNVVGLAYNYRGLVGDRAARDEPLLFLKGPHAAGVVGGGAAGSGCVAVPSWAHCVWVEAELAVVVSRPCFEVSAREARRCVLGFCVASDVTASNVLGRDHHLARSKALPGFAPLSPIVVDGVDPRDRRIETRIDGRLHQSSRTSDMILDPWEAVSLVSRFIPLVPGDVVLTGTPAGAMESRVRPGSAVEHTIEGVGALSFRVVERPARIAGKSSASDPREARPPARA